MLKVLFPAGFRIGPRAIVVTYSAGLQRDSSMTSFIDELIPASQASEVPSTEMRRAAMQIAQQCLCCWDETFGICPGTDAGGAKAGIWRQKLDDVRCAALLLAFQMLNRNLQMQSGRPDMSEATTLRLVFFCKLKQSAAARALDCRQISARHWLQIYIPQYSNGKRSYNARTLPDICNVFDQHFQGQHRYNL